MRPTQSFKSPLSLFVALLMIVSLTACGNETPSSGDVPSQSTVQPSGAGHSAQQDTTPSSDPSGENEDSSSSGNNVLIAFFSRTGENYDVGVIEKGNTHIIADMIAEETGADLFEIVTVNPYPDDYDACTDAAKQEQNNHARPEIVDPPADLEQYDTIYLGYPIWWGDMPMAVYTFLESYDFTGKTIIPFCTHAGSGLSNTAKSIEETCSGATVLEGLAIRGATAQNDQDEARDRVCTWLDGLAA